MTLIVLGLLAIPSAAMALEVVESDRDNYCPVGYALMTYEEATGNRGAVCERLGTWDIARLWGGGSMDGAES